LKHCLLSRIGPEFTTNSFYIQRNAHTTELKDLDLESPDNAVIDEAKLLGLKAAQKLMRRASFHWNFAIRSYYFAVPAGIKF
jgi:hypothetical protein